ncbi:MAG TPA: asparagine synthase (glutamine-hydrolyzing) [Gemmatimonadales bacterium]|nr:asparagine synthase (glutamine-hydrolyzing) [Gemmatimonadales bacterium]
MCGIAGVAYRDPEPGAPERVVRQMCAMLRHRGPDDEGVYARDAVALGMRRLSIIDLSGGRQPIVNEDGSKVIVFNGEIYNYRDLRRELSGRGHRFTTEGDTETILHLYEEVGPRCVERLRGMFAVAIWDQTNRSLFLARDRFGIKPLYYTVARSGLAFASELKALVGAGLTARELDWEALDAYFQLGYIPAPTTPFRDVRKLPPGHWCLWRHTGDTTVQRYWDLPHDIAPAPADLERRVLEWLDDAVGAHLVSDVPVAAFLSGGLDSSAVVASMALATGGEPPHAFTARYFGTGAEAADETALAHALAERYRAPLTLVDIRPDVRSVFEPIVWALDEPHADDSAIPTWVLSRAVGGSFKVVLTGIGGDELFAGYRRHLGFLAALGYARLPAVLRRTAAAAAGLVPDALGNGLTINRLKRFLRAGDGGAADHYLDLQVRADDRLRARLYAPDLRHGITGNAARECFRRLDAQRNGRRGLAAALYLDYKTYLADDILALSDRLSMAHSLEIRVPLVDHELVEHVFPLPAELKVGRWELKRLFKRVLARRLPEAHLRGPKRGFVGPTAAWLRRELRPMLVDELSPDRVKRLGFFDPTVVTRLMGEHSAGRHNHEGILWALLCFSVWHRLFVEGSRVPPALDPRPVLALT